VRACESEDLPAVPGAPRLAAHRLVELGVRLSWLQECADGTPQPDRLCVRWR